MATDPCWQTETADRTPATRRADLSIKIERQTDTHTDRKTWSLAQFSPCWADVSGLVTLPQPEWSLSPSCSAESSPCHSTLLGSIHVWVYAGRHLSTCVTHTRNKTKARTMWELPISANASQPAQRNRLNDRKNTLKSQSFLWTI